MKKHLLIAGIAILSTQTLTAASLPSVSSEVTAGPAWVFKSLGVRDTMDTVATAGLSAAALINLIDLCSSSEKADLLKKAIFGEITGKPRRIILARLGASLLGFAGAWWVNYYRPFMRRKIAKGDVTGLLEESIGKVVEKAELMAPAIKFVVENKDAVIEAIDEQAPSDADKRLAGKILSECTRLIEKHESEARTMLGAEKFENLLKALQGGDVQGRMPAMVYHQD